MINWSNIPNTLKWRGSTIWTSRYGRFFDRFPTVGLIMYTLAAFLVIYKSIIKIKSYKDTSTKAAFSIFGLILLSIAMLIFWISRVFVYFS